MQGRSYKKLKRELLKDREIKKTYDQLGPEFNLIYLLIKKRLEKGLSQKELAEKIGTKQSAISRFESGNYNPSLAFLQKITNALGVELKISIK